VLAILGIVAWVLVLRRRRARWQAIQEAPASAEASPAPAPPADPALERPVLSSLALSAAMDQAVAWADAAEREGRGFWRDARGDRGPDEYLDLFAEVQGLLPEVFGEDILGLQEGPPPEIALRVEDELWLVTLQRQDGFLDEAFWTFLNRVLEARGREERLAAPRLANWRFPLVVSSRSELRRLRERGLGFVGNTPPLYPQLQGAARQFRKQPRPDPAAFLVDLGRALGVGEASAQAALERVGKLLHVHLRKYRMVQLGRFGSFQLRVGPSGQPQLRFRATRPLLRYVGNPVLQPAPAAAPQLPAMDPQTLQAVLACVAQHLALGSGAAVIPGFGLFWRERLPAAIMRQPQNQQPLLVPARRDVVFEPEPSLLAPLSEG
jgi:nucleoid DNA-binding protein